MKIISQKFVIPPTTLHIETRYLNDDNVEMIHWSRVEQRDGETIESAFERALKKVNLHDCLR